LLRSSPSDASAFDDVSVACVCIRSLSELFYVPSSPLEPLRSLDEEQPSCRRGRRRGAVQAASGVVARALATWGGRTVLRGSTARASISLDALTAPSRTDASKT
jgi:hypothetical protein